MTFVYDVQARQEFAKQIGKKETTSFAKEVRLCHAPRHRHGNVFHSVFPALICLPQVVDNRKAKNKRK